MKVSLAIAPALIALLVGGVTSPGLRPQRNATSARSTQAMLEHGDFPTAMRAAAAVHRRAIRDGRWEPLIDAGDAYSRIAVRAGAPEVAGKRAQDAYEAALRSARRAESLEGVLRAAEAFAQLGDAADVELSLHVARELAGSDAEAIADVKAAAVRLSDLLQASPETE